MRRHARHVRSHEHLRRGRDRRGDQGRRAGNFQRRAARHLVSWFAGISHRDRSDRRDDEYFQGRAEFHQLHRGGESGGRRESGAA